MSSLQQNLCACYLWPWLGPRLHGGVVIRYVFPVLWMTSYLRMHDVAAELKRSAHAALGLAVNGAQEYSLQANGRLTG